MYTEELTRLYNCLFDEYGKQHWWPGDTPFETMVGAVLVQNTNWVNAARAIQNLKDHNSLSPDEILSMPDDFLAQLIKPSGYFNLKTKRLKNAVRWWKDNVIDDVLLSAKSPEKWRSSLLKVNGVGAETADCILLYCFNLPFFVIDTYARRVLERHTSIDSSLTYHALQEIFHNSLPRDPQLFNEYHALLVQVGKVGCLKRGCSDVCPLC